MANTSHPFLLLGNTTTDPLIPLQVTKAKMSKGVEGSVNALAQNSVGHCSTSAPSSAPRNTFAIILSLEHLPEPGFVCE
ncbi:hypothetical protein D9613_011383 [Agrocybe pediades]|uniref:Peptidase S33 tripeptidyl aminopeptidase-like C-terminal domain-containing protein n=1 Tax=Agrocybe pediades TaxID=84607 RepID=A0A8H4VQ38_9AGAR|nr:hypothetical protein D9613_011383 [Agrocybe pediades]